MISKIFTLLIIITLPIFVIAQEHNHDEHNHQHKDNHSHKNEISIATGIVPLYEDGEKEITAGFHIHYIRGIGEAKKFGIGLAAETIIDEHKHYTFSTVFQYRIYKGLIIGYSPGLLIRKEENEYLYQFANHFELTYEFEIGKFHIGPVIEAAFEKNGEHYMAGIHFGIEF